MGSLRTVPPLLCFLFSIALSETKQPDMFLCLDSMMVQKQNSDSEPQKLVYGYLNGKKTPCMTEYELRTAYSRESFSRENMSTSKNQKMTRKQNAVYCGEKNLADADLRGFDLQGLDLSGANLENANFESADLRNANLKNANCKGANFENAYCKGTVFLGSNLTDAKLKGTFLQHANLLKTEGLSVDALYMSATLYDAQLEESVIEILKSNNSGKLKKPNGGWDRTVYSEQQQIPASEQANPERFR